MKIKIDRKVFSSFHPQLRIGFISVKEIDNKRNIKESKLLLREMEQLIRLTFHKENIKNHNLIAPWVLAQLEFGAKAKGYHTSLERLIKKILSKRSIATSDVMTNLVRYLSLKHLVPFAVDDSAKIAGNLTFALASGKEKVGPLRTVKARAFFYKDDERVLGTKLDFWKSSKTALSGKSTSALIHFEVLPPITKKKVTGLLREAKSLIESFCGSKVKVFILEKKKSSVKI